MIQYCLKQTNAMEKNEEPTVRNNYETYNRVRVDPQKLGQSGEDSWKPRYDPPDPTGSKRVITDRVKWDRFFKTRRVSDRNRNLTLDI